MSPLSDSIKNLYEDMSEAEATHAAGYLLSFSQTLQGVEARLAHEESNESEYEHIRSTD